MFVSFLRFSCKRRERERGVIFLTVIEILLGVNCCINFFFSVSFLLSSDVNILFLIFFSSEEKGRRNLFVYLLSFLYFFFYLLYSKFPSSFLVDLYLVRGEREA